MAQQEVERSDRLPSARQRRAMSAVQRPTTAAIRPSTASRPRRPYSAYTQRGGEEDTPKFEEEATQREWWRYYLKVGLLAGHRLEWVCLAHVVRLFV